MSTNFSGLPVKSPLNTIRQQRSNISNISLVLAGAAQIAVLVGAVGSAGLMLRAGRRNDSRVLLLLFGIWVLSPFVAASDAAALHPR